MNLAQKTGTTHAALVALAFFLLTASVRAQLPMGRLNTVFPAGGQRGTTFAVRLVSFSDLDEPQTMWFSHPGIRAVPTQRGPEGSTDFTVSIDPAVPDGWYEVRAAGLFGLSNPRGFVVGSIAEVAETEPNNDRQTANAVPINSTANGTIATRGDTDWFSFEGVKGQRVLIQCTTRGIDSPLSATVDVFDSRGKRLARSRDRGVGDLLCDVSPPESGTYRVRVADAAFRGGNENAYRLTIHRRPHIDFVLPLAAQPDTQQVVTVFGRNLPGGVESGVSIDGQPLQKIDSTLIAPQDSATLEVAHPVRSTRSDVDGFAWRLPGSNPTQIQFAASTPVVESEPNDDSATAMTIKLPADITGQFQAKGDQDIFRFECQAKQILLIEAFAARNGTTADPYVEVGLVKTDANGKQTVNRQVVKDDVATNIGGNDFFTTTDDTTFRFTCPQTGLYQVTIRDRYFESRGDASLVYRLAITKPRPDFRIVALAARPAGAANQPYDSGSICLRRGGTCELPIFVHRRDGHADPVEVRATNLPPGVTAARLLMNAGQTRGTLILQAALDAAPGHTQIRVIGTSGSLRRDARPATITRRTAGASQSRLSQNLVLSVLKGSAPLRLAASRTDIHANTSQQLVVPVEVTKGRGFDQDVTIAFEGVPKDVQVESKPIKKGQASASLRLFVTPQAKPGTYQILPRAAATIPFVRNPWRLEREQAAHATVVAADSAAAQRVEAARQKLTKANNDVANLQAAYTAAANTVKVLSAQLARLAKSNAELTMQQKNMTVQLAAMKKQLDARNAAAAALLASGATPDLSEQQAAARKLVASASASISRTNKSMSELTAKFAALSKKRSELSAGRNTAMQTVAAYPQALARTQKLITAAKTALQAAESARADAGKAKADAEKRLDAVKKQTKSQNIKVYEPAAPITLHVAKAPLTMKVDATQAARVKVGANAEITANLAGTSSAPVTLSLIGPGLPSGVTVEAVQLPANVLSGKLTVRVGPGTPPGRLLHTCVRATTEHDGRQYNIDTPVTIEVVK